jgi:hypothetical protein
MLAMPMMAARTMSALTVMPSASAMMPSTTVPPGGDAFLLVWGDDRGQAHQDDEDDREDFHVTGSG